MYNKNNIQRARCFSASTDTRGGVSHNEMPCREEAHTATDGALSLAMVYSVSQRWQLIDDGPDGFNRGTIFNELHKPFFGDKCKRGGICK